MIIKEIRSINDLIGEEVQIYPNDTHKKFGRIIEITDNGVLFLITKADKNCGYPYEVGSYRFISYSANLSFKY
jgi:hypothetical protein